MPSKPSVPEYKPIEKSPPPTQRKSSIFEEEARKQRSSAKRRKGYMSTLITRPGELGQLNIDKQRALGE